MTPKQIRELITKRNMHYTYFDTDAEAWVVFPKSWSLTKCRRFLKDFFRHYR